MNPVNLILCQPPEEVAIVTQLSSLSFVPAASFIAATTNVTFHDGPLYQGCLNRLDLRIDFDHIGSRFPERDFSLTLSADSHDWPGELEKIALLESGLQRLTGSVTFIAPFEQRSVRLKVSVKARDVVLHTIDLGQIDVGSNSDIDVLEAADSLGEVLHRFPPKYRLELLQGTTGALEEGDEAVAFTNIFVNLTSTPGSSFSSPDMKQRAFWARVIGRAGAVLWDEQSQRSVHIGEVASALDLTDQLEPRFCSNQACDDVVALLHEYLEVLQAAFPLERPATKLLHVKSIPLDCLVPNVEADWQLHLFGFRSRCVHDEFCAVDLSAVFEHESLRHRHWSGITAKRPPGKDAAPATTGTFVASEVDAGATQFMDQITKAGWFVDSTQRVTTSWIEFFENNGASLYDSHAHVAAQLEWFLSGVELAAPQCTVVVSDRSQDALHSVLKVAWKGRVLLHDDDRAMPLSSNDAVVVVAPFDTQLESLVPLIGQLALLQVHILCCVSLFGLDAAIPPALSRYPQFALYRRDPLSREWVSLRNAIKTHPLPLLTTEGR